MSRATSGAGLGWWLHVPTGLHWYEHGWRNGRVVLALPGRIGHHITVEPEDLGAPTWMRHPPAYVNRQGRPNVRLQAHGWDARPERTA
jgi:hypothetical protein